ncbi:hypothetical protein HanPI659440_Chr04g0160211 [Helianthus annuus]|nr:hypothetical protein HanPI659440_Chr04g0160211 [Helianthus annuus]
MQGVDISNDPSACKDILSGLGTPFEVLRARGLSRDNRINQFSSMLVGSSIMANAIIEDCTVLGHKEQEIDRLWAEAEAMVKAAREVAKEAKEAEAHGAKALEEADADRNNLNKAAEGLKVEVQNGVTIIEEVTARATEAESPAREAAEVRDSLVSSLDQLKAARDWMCDHGIEHVSIRCLYCL